MFWSFSSHALRSAICFFPWCCWKQSVLKVASDEHTHTHTHTRQPPTTHTFSENWSWWTEGHMCNPNGGSEQTNYGWLNRKYYQPWFESEGHEAAAAAVPLTHTSTEPRGRTPLTSQLYLSSYHIVIFHHSPDTQLYRFCWLYNCVPLNVPILFNIPTHYSKTLGS